MMDASKRQLSKDRPGILCIHIPEINDFADLADNSALQEMAFAFFAKERNDHVCAVAFAYKNAHCRFPDANKISIFSLDKTVDVL